MLKKRFFIFSIVVFFYFSTAHALAQDRISSKRLAILPIITCVPAEPELQEILLHALQHELHVPLNATLHAVDYISDKEISAAMAELHYTDQDLLNKQKLQALNKKLHADITLGIVITNLYEHRLYSSWEQSIILQSGIELHLIGYNQALQQAIQMKSTATYSDEYAPAGELSALTKTSVQELLQKAALKKWIFPLNKINS